MNDNPILVPSTPVPPMLASLIRQLLLIFGSFLVARGWLNDGTVAQITAAAPMVIAIAWSFWSSWDKQAKVSTLASMLPNTVAREKTI